MSKSVIFDNSIIHDSWLTFFSPAIIENLILIEKLIGNDFTPPINNILSFARNDLKNVKIVILGQDPYPQIGAATGRAFEVSGLTSWTCRFKQSSLRNILKLIYRSYNDDLISYDELRHKIENKQFYILPPSEIFEHWENQGVLLVNISLTCEINLSNSHKNIWKFFTKQLIKFVAENNENIYWFLWGKDAQNEIKDIYISNKIKCDHPMICSEKKTSSFVNSCCFSKTKHLIDWTGYNK